MIRGQYVHADQIYACTVRILADIQTSKGRSEDVAAYVPFFGTLRSATSEAEPKGVPLAAV